MKNLQQIKRSLREFVFPVLNLFKYKRTYWYSPEQEKVSSINAKILTPNGQKFSECTTKLFFHKSNWPDAKIVEVEWTKLDKFFWIEYGTIHAN